MGKDVIVALDFDSKEKTLAFLDRFTEEKPFVKIGMELFYAEGPSICFAFEDSGEGVPSSQLSQIFDPLFTSDAGRSVAGLGLSICREILQSHGGKIWAEPRKNRPGLCIRFCLPRV